MPDHPHAALAAATAGGALLASAFFWHRQMVSNSTPPPHNQKQQPLSSSGETLEQLSDSVLAALQTRSPGQVPGVSADAHYVAPFLPKAVWSELGDMVAAREKGTHGNVPGDRWLSLRLDGSGFSKAVSRMRRSGVLPEPSGYSPTFADLMRKSLLALMAKFHGSVGYTQSDEMICFVPPSSVVRGEQQEHSRNGRVAKTATLAAGLVTSVFVGELAKACVEAQLRSAAASASAATSAASASASAG